jgi:hypothetical protein
VKQYAFNLADSRSYWRFAPSGAGKHDTARLLLLNDVELTILWDGAFIRRFRQYAEEEEFLRRMAGEFAGKKILSVGPGLGLHEIHYQLHGAKLTCCDIVESNLRVVERVAALKGAVAMRSILSSGPNTELGGPYDVIFLYGSLMTMPEAMQRGLCAQCLASLAPEGSVVLMLYTWEFARATCGWPSPEEFDPSVFAQASDPTVGNEHCPWSDWHDDEKLRACFGRQLHVTRRQLWNQGWFVWYELRRNPVDAISGFFDPGQMMAEARCCEIDIAELVPVDATTYRTDGGICVQTSDNEFGYALTTKASEPALRMLDANAVLIEADVYEGGISIGLLDEEQNQFAFSKAIWEQGRSRHLFALDRIPSSYRIIISNYRPRRRGVSRFLVHRLALLERSPLIVPRNRNAA